MLGAMSFERGALATAQLEDLDLDRLMAFAERRSPFLAGLPPDEAAARLGLAHKAGPRTMPTAAGLLTFGRLPQLMHPEWGVAAVRIDGLAISDPIRAREDIEGDVLTLVRASQSFVERHTRTLTDQVQPDCAESEYADVALREALANAVLHRDLRKSGRVALRIFDDRLEVWSPGGLPDGVGELDELVQDGGVSLPRNPLLAATARLLGLGEQLGRGLATMRRAVTQLPSQRLEIRSSPSDFLVVLPSQLRRPLSARPLT